MLCAQKAASKSTSLLLWHHDGITMYTCILPRGRDVNSRTSLRPYIAKYVGPCLQVRVSQRLAELARRPPVPVKISGRQVTEGPALERHLQGLIQQLSLTGEAEQSLHLQLTAWCCVTQHCPAVCSVASPMGEWWLQTEIVIYLHLVPPSKHVWESTQHIVWECLLTAQ